MVLTTSTEGPILMQMVGSPSSDDLTCAVMPRLNRLINFDDSSWAEQLEADGFNSRHMEAMEDLLDSFFDTAHLEESLIMILKETKDITEGEELTNAIQHWSSQILWAAIWQRACRSGFPDPIDVMAFTARFLLAISSSNIQLERIKRARAEDPEPDWSMDAEEVREGKALAELGMEEDAAQWPIY